MLQFLLGIVAGVVLSALLRFVEPLERWVSKLGRGLARDSGCEVHVTNDHARIWAGSPPHWLMWAFRAPPGVLQQEPPKDLRQWQRWIRDRGGVDLWESQVEVTLVGTSPTTVVIHPPRVSVTTAELPPGVNLYRPAGGGADLSPRQFEVDLDTAGPDNPIVTFADLGGGASTGVLRWSLERGESESIMIRVFSEQDRLISWTARIPVVIDGKERHVDITDDGKPFVFAGGRVEDGHAWFGPEDGVGGTSG